MASAALPAPEAGSPRGAEPVRVAAERRRSAPLAAPLCAWCLSVGALLHWLFSGAGGPAGSPLALALVPWVALAGLPRRSPAGHRHAARAALVWPALALPPLALALALERGAASAGWRLLAAGLALVTLWSLAAESVGSARRARAYGLAWLVFVPGAAALVFALRFAALPGERPAPAWLEGLARAHPLLWAWRAGQALGPWPLVVGALAWGLARGTARGARSGAEESAAESKGGSA